MMKKDSFFDLDRSKRYLVAVSGGPDSMALLDMLFQASYGIEVAHVNYHKRQSADRDERIVRDYCRRNHIPFHKKDAAYEEYSGNFQAYARDLRYRYFCTLCKRYKLEAVLVAHQKDDHIETYLMQKEKNLSVSCFGLARINSIQGVQVIRPLLEYDKKQLQNYCDDQKIIYGKDETNDLDLYARNRIRHQIVNVMNDKEKECILKEIEEKNQQKEKEESLIQPYLNKDAFTMEEFLKIPYPYLYLRKIFSGHSSSFYQELYRQIKDSRHMVHQENGKYLVKEYGMIHLFESFDPFEYTFFKMEEIRYRRYSFFAIRKKGDSFHGVTLKKEDFPITIRNVREGDYIQMNYGRRKIHRFFIDSKICLKQRKQWPVVVNKNNEIILVPGIGCDQNHYSNNHNMFVVLL